MKYLNFEGLQYFYSKLSSSLASQYVSLGNLKTINGQSLIGSGNISLLSNPVSGTFNVGGTASNVPTINIKREDTPHPAIILSEGGLGGLASIVIQHAGTGDLGTTINRNGISIAGKSSSDLLTAAGNTTSLKTINNQSLLGSGNITIEGGASGDYLPLSGGTLTGNLYMTSDEPILTMTGKDGYSITLNAEKTGNESTSIDLLASDGSTTINLTTSEGVALLDSNALRFRDNFEQIKAKYTDLIMQMGTSEGDNIRITSADITKNGESIIPVALTQEEIEAVCVI